MILFRMLKRKVNDFILQSLTPHVCGERNELIKHKKISTFTYAFFKYYSKYTIIWQRIGLLLIHNSIIGHVLCKLKQTKVALNRVLSSSFNSPGSFLPWMMITVIIVRVRISIWFNIFLLYICNYEGDSEMWIIVLFSSEQTKIVL